MAVVGARAHVDDDSEEAKAALTVGGVGRDGVELELEWEGDLGGGR